MYWSAASSLVSRRLVMNQGGLHERHYRYVCWEGGHMAQNVYLAAEAAGLGACMVGSFLDGLLNDLLRIAGRREAALGLVTVGPR